MRKRYLTESERRRRKKKRAAPTRRHRHSTGLPRSPAAEARGACFTPAVYYYLDIGKYKYSDANPAPANPE